MNQSPSTKRPAHTHRHIARLAFVAALGLTGINTAVAGGNLDFGGLVQAHAAPRTNHTSCAPVTECALPFYEQRLQLKVEGGGLDGTVGLAGKLDLIHDAALDNTEADLRELYADYNAERFTHRAGRQVITWGVADLLFVNDTFPKDWVSFFYGMPTEYLKRGSDALRLDLFPEVADVQIVLARFRRDRLPERDRFVLPGPEIYATLDEPQAPEAGLRISRYFGSWDGALYFSRTHYRAPALLRSGGQWRGEFPRLNAYGASLSGPLWNGVLNLEAGHYDSRDDLDGTNPAVENSQMRFLAGYSRQIAEDTTLGLQGYAELMSDYDEYKRTLPAGFSWRDKVRTVATLRLTQFHLHQTLRLGLFAFGGISEGDGYIIPSVRYAFSDALWGEMGANLFVGAHSGQFGALGKNDNIYATLRYAF